MKYEIDFLYPSIAILFLAFTFYWGKAETAQIQCVQKIYIVNTQLKIKPKEAIRLAKKLCTPKKKKKENSK